MTKIVLFNAPPGAGKDTLANMMAGRVTKPSETVKFAAPLKAVAMMLYCGGDSKLFNEFDGNQTKKVEKHKQFLDKTCRQVQIDISEVYMKPMHGEQVFGKFLAQHIERRIDDGIEVFFVSDSGFRPEAEVLVEEFGPQNILLVRIHREGYNYDKDPESPTYDSRNYIELADLGVQELDLDNIDGDVNTTLDVLTKTVTKFIAGE